MSKLEQLLIQYSPNEVKYYKLGDIITFINGRAYKQSELLDSGKYRVLRVGNFFTSDKWYFSNLELDEEKYCNEGDLLYAWAASLGPRIWDGEKTIFHYHIWKLEFSEEIVTKKYLYHFLLKDVDDISDSLTHSTMPHVSMANMKERIIPVPPIDVQNKIVKVLDSFSELANSLTMNLSKEISSLKQKYDYYREKMLMCEGRTEVDRVKLGSIGKVCMCKRILKSQTNSEGGIPFFKIGTFGKEPDAYIDEDTYLEYRKKYSYPRKGNILISAAGTIGRTVVFDGSPSYFQDSNIVWIDNDATKVLDSYLRCVYQTNPWYVSDGGTISRLYNSNIENAEISFPKDINEQKKIVEYLDDLTKLITDVSQTLSYEIELRKKQYRYYRNKLLSFNTTADKEV